MSNCSWGGGWIDGLDSPKTRTRKYQSRSVVLWTENIVENRFQLTYAILSNDRWHGSFVPSTFLSSLSLSYHDNYYHFRGNDPHTSPSRGAPRPLTGVASVRAESLPHTVDDTKPDYSSACFFSYQRGLISTMTLAKCLYSVVFQIPAFFLLNFFVSNRIESNRF